MIAAYIFYLIMNVLPDLSAFMADIKQELGDYRRLQLMSVKLFSLYRCLIEQTGCVLKPKDKKLEDFYNEEFLKTTIGKIDFQSNFTLKARLADFKGSTCKDFYLFLWNDIESYGRELLSSRFVRVRPDLWLQINELINESSLKTLADIFKVDKTSSFKCIDFSWVENVLELHYSAFEWYKYLRLFYGEKRKYFYSPPFFKSQS